MAKFSTIAKGSRAEKPSRIPAPNAFGPDGETIQVIIRALNGTEEETALIAARTRAIRDGVGEPKVGEPIYDLALMVETVAIALLDSDSPTEDRQQFFDGGADQVLQHYGREAIVYVYELQQAWQDEAAPTLKQLSSQQVIEAFTKLGGEDETEARAFFSRLRPGLQWSCVRTLAALLSTSPTPSSTSGGNSGPAGQPTKKRAGGRRRANA